MSAAHLTPAVVLVVLGAGVLHATWNALAKRIGDQLVAFGFIGVALTVGGGVLLGLTGLPAAACAGYAAASTVLHLAYDLALMRCYRIGALNQTYPIARGISPLVVTLGAYVVAGERLGAAGLCGVVVLGGGLAALALSSGRGALHDRAALGAAALTGLLIASYTLVDGLGVRHAGDPFAYAALLFVLEGPVLPVLAWVRRPAAAWRDGALALTGLAAGTLCFVAYGAVLWAQARAPLGEVAALRETSVISAALIGAAFLHERFGTRRAVAAAIVAAGILLIAA